MSGKRSKALRRLAAALVTAEPGMHEKKGTGRVKTETDPSGKILGRVYTSTQMHRKGSFRNILKRLKRDEVGTLVELGVVA